MLSENLSINITPNGVPTVIHITQYDVGLRRFVFTPYTSEGTFTPDTAASATLEGTKPDGNAFIHNCSYNSSTGVITYTIQEQLAAVAGRVWSKLVVRNTSGAAIGYAAIIWIVDMAGVQDDAIVSDSDLSALEEFVNEFGTINAYRGALNGALAAVGSPLVASTAASMTDRTKVYVYTGSESGYTNGHWYYWNGSAWTDGGVYNSVAVNTDKTLTVANMAADGKATGDAITQLKNDVSLDYTIPIVWERGSLDTPANNGAEIYSTTRLRSQYITHYSSDIIHVNIPEGYKCAYRSYTLNDGVFTCVGTASFTTGYLDIPYTGYYYRLLLAYSDNSTIIASAGDNAVVSEAVYTDTSLSIPRKSADAKATGDAIADLRNDAFVVRGDIKTDTDLNTLTNIGIYMLFTNYNYTNAPSWYTSGSAWLLVYKNETGGQICQMFIQNTTGEIYYRRMGTSGTTQTWYPWIKYYINELYKNLTGKKLSIVGDSISTFAGYLPADYATYYPYGDLDNVNKTWWKQVIDTSGMSLLVNASWAGSWVCYDSSVSADSAKVAYTDARINALGENPDIIIVFIGTNDFIHNGGNPLGTFDINSELPEEATPITDFKPAYATMINKIRTRYPAAHVYCCTLLERYRGTVDQSYPIKNGSGVSLASYNRAILDIAEWTGCRVIRLDTAFSLGQIPELTVDGTLHPNAAGAKIIANYVLTVLTREEKSLI